MEARDRIIFALDVPGPGNAFALVEQLHGRVGAFKIGLELFIAAGPSLVREIVGGGDRVMLDLKLHDIPETVERAVLRAADLGVTFCTMHIQQRETMRRAVKAAEGSGMTLLGVTVLTSMTREDGFDLCLPFEPSIRASIVARVAHEEGLRGFVCSPMEVNRLSSQHTDAVFVVPGIRPAGAATGDQKRVGTPAEAVRDGATYLVVGRPIRDAVDPAAAADSIAAEIATT